MQSAVFSNTDQYIAMFPPEIAEKLTQIREIIRKAAPKTIEVISYNMPAFKANKVLVYFAANKNHIGFYPTSEPMRVFADELKAYKTSKGAVQFPYNQPLPEKIITKMVKFRLEADALTVKKKS